MPHASSADIGRQVSSTTQAGRLDVAATLSSLYPVTTILLAIALLGERVTRSHAAGILAAMAGIALIGAGGGT